MINCTQNGKTSFPPCFFFPIMSFVRCKSNVFANVPQCTYLKTVGSQQRHKIVNVEYLQENCCWTLQSSNKIYYLEISIRLNFNFREFWWICLNIWMIRNKTVYDVGFAFLLHEELKLNPFHGLFMFYGWSMLLR